MKKNDKILLITASSVAIALWGYIAIRGFLKRFKEVEDSVTLLKNKVLELSLKS